MEAQSRWVLKLARSSARCTPREDTKREKTGGRWAAARRRAAAALGGGAPPPNGPRGRRPLGGWRAPPRARTSRPPHNTHQPQSNRRTHSVHEPQKEPLSFRKSSFSRAHLSAAAILCDHFSSLSSNFRSFAFLAGFALFPKSRKVTKIGHTVELQIYELSRFLWFLAGVALFPKSRNVTKIDHTVWPPPINGNKKRKDSAFHSGRVQVLLWCRLCQTATIITWQLGKRRKRPKPKPTAAAATPNEPKGTKRTRRRHSVQQDIGQGLQRGRRPSPPESTIVSDADRCPAFRHP